MQREPGEHFLLIGDLIVSDSPAIMRTVLGSCVSVCLYDVKKGIGGMNHFRNPTPPKGNTENIYGVNAVPGLVQEFLDRGALLGDLRAQIYGGANRDGLPEQLQVGLLNSRLAKKILSGYGIPITEERTGGCYGRRVAFDTGSNTVTSTELDHCLGACPKTQTCPYRLGEPVPKP